MKYEVVGKVPGENRIMFAEKFMDLSDARDRSHELVQNGYHTGINHVFSH